ADMLERVFDPFERIPGAGGPAGSGHGLGLGLALVRQLVELHGGCVRALSPGEGKGSTIVVELPLRASNT
ncbi:MAG TPA: ATP-binding protein, partial [Kofleriaceae bacterium]|nr:ATP-binding protein [Kofleriaceae bacterium]